MASCSWLVWHILIIRIQRRWMYTQLVATMAAVSVAARLVALVAQMALVAVLV